MLNTNGFYAFSSFSQGLFFFPLSFSSSASPDFPANALFGMETFGALDIVLRSLIGTGVWPGGSGGAAVDQLAVAPHERLSAEARR